MHNTEPKLFICDYCDKHFTHRDNIIKHFQIHLDRKYTCDLCDAKFKTLGCLKKHRQAHVSIKCGLCPRTFNFRKEYKTHHRNVHSNHKKTFQMIEETPNEIIITNQDVPPTFQEACLDCNKIFYSKQGLAKHICSRLSTGGVAELVCGVEDCNFITTDATGYLEHQAAVHAIPIDTNRSSLTNTNANASFKLKMDRFMDICNGCNKTFKSKKGFREHKCKGSKIDYDLLRKIGEISEVKAEQIGMDIDYGMVETDIVGSEVIIS